jgi:cardiolipin synthase
MAEFISWFFSTIWPWIFIVGHGAIVLVASAHVVLHKRDSRSAIGWVGIIWLTPIIGTALYLTFGINRIQRKARLLRGGQGQVTSTPDGRAVEEEILHRALGDDALHLASLVKYVSRLTHQPLLDGNAITPLTTGRQAYDEMLAAIAGAQRTIGLATYMFDNDSLGRRFVDVLAAAHDRGVAVRVLIDDVGTRYT